MNFITISAGNVTSFLAYIGQAVTGLGPLIWLAVGVPFAFYVVRKAISLIPKR